MPETQAELIARLMLDLRHDHFKPNAIEAALNLAFESGLIEGSRKGYTQALSQAAPEGNPTPKEEVSHDR